MPRDHFQRSTLTRSRDIDKNKKKFFNLPKNHRAVTSADAHVTIFSALPPPGSKILTKNKKKNSFYLHQSRDIDKNEKNFENLAKSSCGDVSKCPRNNFQRSTSPEAEILTKNEKIFLIWQIIIVR
ncbi:hypothetical protein PUN28_003704 [Cardiocondyla obscurior]|uniref:Uncharacterized protein n=1 Tax=Cardiocondyla obscurior TaxID=286306 RepID=A0AAW2GNE4_9HYME